MRTAHDTTENPPLSTVVVHPWAGPNERNPSIDRCQCWNRTELLPWI